MWRFFILLPFISLQAEITALYLSWYGDPTTTMTIQWHTPEEEPGDSIALQMQENEWKTVQGDHVPIDYLLVHKVSLENLTPNTEYAFRIGEDQTVYRFRTAPNHLDQPLRFIIGGDVYSSTKLFRRMAKTVLDNHPQFVVLGGDIAYALGVHPFRSSPLRHWISFFKDWKNHMIYPDGLIVPFLIVPGNHDIKPDNYDLFFRLFAFPEKQLYRTVDFGSYLSLFLLDTGHFQPVDGRQTVWLDKALAAHQTTHYRLAVYHEAAYPSFYPYHGSTPKKIRTNWCPLFDKYHLLAAFENHNHAYKRTYPIKANQVDPTGVVYFGDGCWGVHPRKTNNAWYLDKRGRKNNVFLVEITEQEATVEAIDLFNTPIDRLQFK
jgi:hypothetical protein